MTATLAAHRAQARLFPAHFTATVLNATHFLDGLCAAQRQISQGCAHDFIKQTDGSYACWRCGEIRPAQLTYDPTWLSRP